MYITSQMPFLVVVEVLFKFRWSSMSSSVAAMRNDEVFMGTESEPWRGGTAGRREATAEA